MTDHVLIEGKINLSPEERQAARKQRLREYCNSHTYDKSPTPEDLHMHDEQKFIYYVNRLEQPRGKVYWLGPGEIIHVSTAGLCGNA